MQSSDRGLRRMWAPQQHNIASALIYTRMVIYPRLFGHEPSCNSSSVQAADLNRPAASCMAEISPMA
eukprot:1082835-Karenia_brevis.AAC.1